MASYIPTLRLLSASILLALSGVFRIYIASLFLGIEPGILIYFAGFLIVYATYTFDRALGGEEDKINRKELVSSRRDIALFLCLISLIVGSFIFYQEDLIWIAFLPIAIGYIYSKGLRLGRHRLKLKGSLGMKNLTVSLTWGTFISGIVQRWTNSELVILFIFPFFTIKSFINTVIYDFKDVEGDKAAGVRTLPICLGEKMTRKLLQSMHILLHTWMAFAMFTELIRFEIIILFIVSFNGIIYTCFYTKPSPVDEAKLRKKLRDTLVHGEFILAVLFRALIGS